jgi:hypothetical protein
MMKKDDVPQEIILQFDAMCEAAHQMGVEGSQFKVVMMMTFALDDEEKKPVYAICIEHHIDGNDSFIPVAVLHPTATLQHMLAGPNQLVEELEKEQANGR